MTETEPEWDADEQALRLAYLEDKADRCSGCGQPISESAHHDADPNNPDRKYMYQVSNPIVCHSCRAKDQAITRWRKQPHLKDLNINAVTRRVDLA